MMKFGKIMQLWIMGLIFLVSVSAYAADQDTLTVSPTGVPGVYELTISGTRDSDTARVSDKTVSISNPYCLMGQTGCISSVNVRALIVTGNNPVSSTYQQKFKVSLEPAIYSFSYLVQGPGVQDKSGKVITPPDGIYFEDWLIVDTRPPVSISLQNATAEISGTDSFTLRNLAAETTDSQGVNQKFNTWGKFQWNPNSLSWELKDAGTEK